LGLDLLAMRVGRFLGGHENFLIFGLSFEAWNRLRPAGIGMLDQLTLPTPPQRTLPAPELSDLNQILNAMIR
jgi:hypothetical protein